MADKRNARKSKASRASAKSKPVATPRSKSRAKPVATPSRSSTRKRNPSVKAAASRIGKKGPAHLQLEDEGVSQDDIAEDILADLDLTPDKNDAHYAPSDGSKNDLQASEDGYEEFDMVSEGDDDDSEEGDSEPRPRRIEFKKKKNNQTRGGMLAILSHSLRDSSYEIPQVDLRFKLSKLHLKFLTMADLKNCRFRRGPHGQ